MKDLKACFMKNTDDWKTPKKIYDYFMQKGYIDTFEYKSNYNQFEKIYENKKIYMNPPFSKLKDIPEYINKLLDHNNEIVLLIPARTDTKYFHELIKNCPQITFIKGRLAYNDKGTAPFPSIIMTFKPYYRECPIPLYDTIEQTHFNVEYLHKKWENKKCQY